MMGFLAALGAWFSRGLATGPRKAATGAGLASVLAAAVAFVDPWEGERTEAYLDRIASPAVWTICYGETKGVKAGDRYSSAECKAMLETRLAAFHAELSACIPALPRQPQGVQVALTSWAYNVGTGPKGACGSTLARLANAGDWRGACNQLPRWDKAGSPPRPVRGLTLRRAAEAKLCNDSLGG